MPDVFTENDVHRLITDAAPSGSCELGYNALGRAAAAETAAAAEEAGLRSLSIYRAGLADEACLAMMPRLGSNSCLTELSLGYNAIGDAGAKAIGSMLRNNTVLKKLLLHQNHIGNDGTEALALALYDNSTLDTLSLANNSVGERGVAALAAALKDDNWALTSCNLGHNNTEGDASQRGGKSELVRMLEIAAACERNKDSAKVADGMARRQRRRLAATRAENERKKRELAECREQAQGIGNDLAAKMARLLAGTGAPKPAATPEPEPEPEVAEVATVAGRWRAMVPRKTGDTVEFMLKLELRPDFSDASGGKDGTQPVGVAGKGEQVGYSMDEGRVKRWPFAVTGGRWDARAEGGDGLLELQLRFQSNDASVVKDRGGKPDDREEWVGSLPLGSDVAVLTYRRGDFTSDDSFTLRRLEDTEEWEPVGTPPATPKAPVLPAKVLSPPVALQPTPPKTLLPKLSVTPRVLPAAKPATPRSPNRPVRETSWRMPAEPLPVLLPTPRTYKELVSELQEALPRRLAAWA